LSTRRLDPQLGFVWLHLAVQSRNQILDIASRLQTSIGTRAISWPWPNCSLRFSDSAFTERRKLACIFLSLSLSLSLEIPRRVSFSENYKIHFSRVEFKTDLGARERDREIYNSNNLLETRRCPRRQSATNERYGFPTARGTEMRCRLDFTQHRSKRDATDGYTFCAQLRETADNASREIEERRVIIHDEYS